VIAISKSHFFHCSRYEELESQRFWSWNAGTARQPRGVSIGWKHCAGRNTRSAGIRLLVGDVKVIESCWTHRDRAAILRDGLSCKILKHKSQIRSSP
jgi:hypothetical protein